ASMALGVSAAPSPIVTSAPSLEARRLALKRDSLPASSGSSVLSDVQTIAAGESFDGGMFAFDRGVDCEGQTEGGDSDAVFQIEEGGSLSNVIIGPNQMEGIHCQGACTLTNVWWSAVCEDAFTIKNQDAGDTTYINGGGAFGADDKVFQHNGAGSLSVSDFTVDTFGKLYRSCGNCDSMYERHVIMDSITASDGDMLAGI
ncbi:pectate lyase, partial [Truncatella angustata]